MLASHAPSPSWPQLVNNLQFCNICMCCCAEMGSALSTTVKASVVKRVVESYAACAIQFAALLKQRPAAEGSNAAAVQTGASVMHARGEAASAACKDVLAAKWTPP